jgi:glutamine synthetase
LRPALHRHARQGAARHDPARLVDEDFFADGKMFDGSSIAGWKGINESDMILMPDPSTRRHRPVLRGDHGPAALRRARAGDHAGLRARPALTGRRAEAYLKSTGIADGALFGPENEFFIFDSARWTNEMNGCFLPSTRCRVHWNSGTAV